MNKVFSSVANRYDLMNDLMSFGLHRAWKKVMLQRLHPQPGMCILDIGGGTGDIAFGILKQGGSKVVVTDINSEMLSIGRDRAIDRGIINDIEWILADAEALPFVDSSMDACVTAFCLRNVANIEIALAEAHRVLKPGGHFLCLEFSRVVLPLLSKIYDAWSFNFIPRIGACIAGDRAAYEYLVRSIREFPDQETFKATIEAAHFSYVRSQNLSGGIVAVHSGWRT